jgi:Cu/Ag efflux protein CusF
MQRRAILFAAVLLSPPLWAQSPSIQGEVTKLDKAGGRITLKHGEIKHLDMPPMTMVFRAANPKLLDGLAVGDRVRFSAERINGQYTVTAVGKVP